MVAATKATVSRPIDDPPEISIAASGMRVLSVRSDFDHPPL
jgi:hypothetical protein